jgi:hypothetical protein
MDADLAERIERYFQKSQEVKREIERTPDIRSKVESHIDGRERLESEGGGNSHAICLLGRAISDSAIALRENRHLVDGNMDGMVAAVLYNDYCLEAERDLESPEFCVCGVYQNIPFLLVQDVTDFGAWKIIPEDGIFSSTKYIYLSQGKKSISRKVDLGTEDIYRHIHEKFDQATQDAILFREFDIGTLKYFHPDARLNW